MNWSSRTMHAGRTTAKIAVVSVFHDHMTEILTMSQSNSQSDKPFDKSSSAMPERLPKLSDIPLIDLTDSIRQKRIKSAAICEDAGPSSKKTSTGKPESASSAPKLNKCKKCDNCTIAQSDLYRQLVDRDNRIAKVASENMKLVKENEELRKSHLSNETTVIQLALNNQKAAEANNELSGKLQNAKGDLDAKVALQVVLMRNITEQKNRIEELSSENTKLTQDNETLRKACEDLRGIEETFRQLSTDHQKTLEANRNLTNRLQHMKRESESRHVAFDGVLRQVRELERAGYIAITLGSDPDVLEPNGASLAATHPTSPSSSSIPLTRYTPQTLQATPDHPASTPFLKHLFSMAKLESPTPDQLLKIPSASPAAAPRSADRSQSSSQSLTSTPFITQPLQNATTDVPQPVSPQPTILPSQLQSSLSPTLCCQGLASPASPRTSKSMYPEHSIPLKRSPSPSIDLDRPKKRMRPDEAHRDKVAVTAPDTHTDAKGTVSPSQCPSLVPNQDEVEEENVRLERGPDGLFKEEEVVLHLFESDEDDDGLLQCPFCQINSDMPLRNFANASATILLQHYKDNHAHILAKVCQEGLDILYSD